MSENILDLFVGLTPDQVRTLRARIVPTLQELRQKVVTSTNQNEGASQAIELESQSAPAHIHDLETQGKQLEVTKG